MNRGLIKENLPVHVGFVGGPGSQLPDLVPDGDWEPYLPEPEQQAKWNLETMACVSFSRLSASEIQARYHGRVLELSDRYLAWASGTTKQGNRFSTVDFTFRGTGTPPEVRWPWLTPLDWSGYYSTPPDDVKLEAKTLLSEWDIGQLVWVPADIDSMKAALKKGPLWFCNENHAMVIYRIDDRIQVWDSYGSCKGSFPLDYVQHIEACYLAPFSPKEIPMIFVPDTLYQLVEGIGGFLWFHGGRMYRDTEAKLLASWMVASSKPQPDGTYGFAGGRTGRLKLADIKDVQLYSLKGEMVSLGNPV